MVTFTQSIRAVSTAYFHSFLQHLRTQELGGCIVHIKTLQIALTVLLKRSLGQFVSHKTVPGIRGPVITTAEQQLAPTSCSTLTVVRGGHASPQESTSTSQHVLQSIPNLAQRQLLGAAEAPAQPQCYRRHH